MKLALLGLAPLAVLAGLAIYFAAQAHRAELARSTLDLSRAVASVVQSEFDGALMTLASLARAPELQAGDLPAFHQRARRLMELQTEWTAITLADTEGRVLLGTNRPFRPEPIEPREAASLQRVLRTGQPVIGKVVPDSRGEPSVAVRYPVVMGDRLEYVLTAALTPERLVAMLERQRVPDRWVIAILDHDLRIFARSKAQAQYALREATPGLRRLAESGRSEGNGLTPSQEGPLVVTGFSRTPEAGWLVAVGAPTTPLAGGFTPTVALYLAGALGSLLICALLALRAARRISADIRQVADTAASLGEGRRAPVMASPIVEIDRLGRALREASDRLHAAQAAQSAALEQAQDASRAKDDFLAMLGHELRNPLAPMVAAMYLLDARSDPASARERTILRRQMHHLRRLVDDLLDVARIARGEIDVQPEALELVTELAAVVDDVRQAHPDAPEIHFERGVVQAWVHADSRRLAQVFTNLLTNAIRYGAGRPIRVAIGRAGDDTVRVSVADEGQGMSAQTLLHVFEPFYQAPQNPGRPQGGLGLGLAIVRSIVAAHGGTVEAQSAGPDQGSRFEVVLPLMQRSGQPA